MFVNVEGVGAVSYDKLEELKLSDLVKTYNTLRPQKPVKKFKDKPTAVKRVGEAFAEEYPEDVEKDDGPDLGAAAQAPLTEEQKAERQAQEDAPGPGEQQTETAPPTAPAQGSKEREKLSYPLQEPIKPHRPNTRRGKVIRLMRRQEGASFEELSEETGWSEKELRVTLKSIHMYLGHGITEDDNGRLHLIGVPLDRKPFEYPKKDEIKSHRPGTKRAKTIELLSREEGAKMEEIKETNGWNDVQAFQGVTLLHTYLGYGLNEDEDGNIFLIW